MSELVLIAHNIRSTHNVGSLLRTSDGLGVSKVYLTGYTPYPKILGDARLPHLAEKLSRQIHKTALGAEEQISWDCRNDVTELIKELKSRDFQIAALEQAAGSVPLESFQPSEKIALIIGREVEGIEKDILKEADKILEIRMFGRKESFNVAVAAGIALHHLKHNQQ